MNTYEQQYWIVKYRIYIYYILMFILFVKAFVCMYVCMYDKIA